MFLHFSVRLIKGVCIHSNWEGGGFMRELKVGMSN